MKKMFSQKNAIIRLIFFHYCRRVLMVIIAARVGDIIENALKIRNYVIRPITDPWHQMRPNVRSCLGVDFRPAC